LVQPARKKSKAHPGVPIAGSSASARVRRWDPQGCSSTTSLIGFVAWAISELQRRSTFRADDGNKDYGRSNHTMATIRPSRTSRIPNPPDISLQSCLTHIIRRGYEIIQSLEHDDTDLNEPCFDFLRDLPFPTLADIVIRGGMTPKQVRLMNRGKSFTRMSSLLQHLRYLTAKSALVSTVPRQTVDRDRRIWCATSVPLWWFWHESPRRYDARQRHRSLETFSPSRSYFQGSS
jgi:hypothetical protein